MSKFVLAAALTVLWGCGSTKTVTIRDGSDATIHVSGKDGASVDIGSGKTIADYPADTPLYPGKSTLDVKSEKKHSRVVTLESPDPIEKVSEFYKSGFEKNGWKLESTVGTPQVTIFTATKDTRKAAITISNADGHVSISQTLSEK